MKRFGLSGKERIKSRKDFEIIFDSGKVMLSSDSRIKASFIYKESSEPGVKIAAAVSRKAGIAVWRNRAKRLIKEAYRLNKEILTEVCLQKKIQLKLVFAVNSLNQKKNRNLMLDDIKPGVLDIMLKLKNII